MTLAPRLLSVGQARRYLGGADPDELVDPVLTRAGVRYDRAALDAKLDQLSGLNRPLSRDDADSALQGWLEQSHGARLPEIDGVLPFAELLSRAIDQILEA